MECALLIIMANDLNILEYALFIIMADFYIAHITCPELFQMAYI